MSVKPRFEMIPSGYDVGVLGSQVPNTSVGDFDVVRTGVATRVNAQGLIEEVAPNVPRLDYSDGGCPKLLTEVGSENLITYSEDFSQSVWINENTELTSNAESIDGGDNAYELTNISSGGYLSYYYTFVGSETFSVFVKKSNSNFCRVFTAGRSVYVDLSNGNVAYGDVAPIDFKVKYISNGWHRISTTGSYVGLSTVRVYPAKSMSEDADAGGSIYFFGAQLEEGNPTSYIPTNGATETRGTDIVTGAGNAETFNSVSGYLFADVKFFLTGITSAISINDGTDQNVYQIFKGSNESLNVVIKNAGAPSQVGLANYCEANLHNKVLVALGDDNVAFSYINGIKLRTAVAISPLNPDALNTLSLDRGNGGNKYTGKLNSIKHGNALTDDQYEAMTGYTSYQDIANQFGFKQL